jgi:alpha-1,3-rhamnosyl/mannosyltransferase
MLRERWWFELRLPQVARAAGCEVLLMPVNLSARRGPIPQLVTILDVNFLSEPGTYDPAYVAYARRMFARSVRDADRLTAISEYSRQEIARHLGADPERITVVYPGLTPPPPSTTAFPLVGAPYALYVGATEPHKNLGLLLDAWHRDSPAGLDLAIVGRPGRDHGRLRRRAAELGGQVRVVGAVDAQELESWYAGASAFVFPSRSEGFGYPPLEAMQRGVPVVVARAGALPEVLGDAALYHDPDDGEALRAHLEAVASDPAMRAGLIERGRARAARYTWSASARTVARLLHELAGR